MLDVTQAELDGFRKALQEHAQRMGLGVELESSDYSINEMAVLAQHFTVIIKSTTENRARAASDARGARRPARFELRIANP
jgi:hypothetical protein